MSVDKIRKLATALQSAEAVIKELKAQMEPYEASVQAYREEILAELKKTRLTTYKGEDGISYSRVFRSKIIVTSLPEALQWAQSNDCVKVDTVKAQALLKGAGALPEGIGYEETENLRVNSPKAE